MKKYMKKSKLFAVFATVIIGGSIVGVLICANPENVVFQEPQRAITPGQSAVFYINDMILGGGKIVK